MWVAALALSLAAVGMVFVVRQVKSLTGMLQTQAQLRATQIAETARTLADRQVDSVLREVVGHLQMRSGDPWVPGGDWPGWIDGVFAHEGTKIYTIAEPGLPGAELSDWLNAQLLEILRRPDSEAEGVGRDVIFGSVEGQSRVLVCRRYRTAAAGSGVAALMFQPERLRENLVEPLLSGRDGLELVEPTGVARPWSQPMFGLVRFWEIQPTPDSLRQQRSTVIGHTLAYVSLTILAMATLLVAVAYLGRLAQREVALAEMKANFVADVSHELKTPLATIQLFSETLQSGRASTEEKRQEYYAVISRETVRLTNLINNILDFSRIEADRREYTLKPTDLREVIRETYESYVPQLDHHHFQHRLVMSDSLPLVDADRDAIAQVVLNLMNNTLKYSSDDPDLTIDVACDTRRDHQGVLISFHDRGIGIRPEDHARLFEGFFRAADSRVRQRGGTGLGLALVKHIVEAHGGSIQVESRLVKGTTFRIFLPASESTESSNGSSS